MTGKSHSGLGCGLGRGRNAYFHGFVLCESGDNGGPGCPANHGCLLVLIALQDTDLQTDSVTFDVCELREGLDSDSDGLLDELIDQQCG